MRFRVFRRRGLRGARWYFQGRSDGNNRVILQSEGYHNQEDAFDTIALIQREAAGATIHIEEK